MVWQLVAACFAGLNTVALSEPWTNWMVLGFACQVLLLLRLYRVIRRHEDTMTYWFAWIFRKLER
jgi:hypothetical protein